jgi:hypothetical protein
VPNSKSVSFHLLRLYLEQTMLHNKSTFAPSNQSLKLTEPAVDDFAAR